MFFCRYDRARKHHKTLSCNFFGVHVSLVHSLTLLVRPGRIIKTLELDYDYEVKGMMTLLYDIIRYLIFASTLIYSVIQMLACSVMVFDS